MRIMLQALMVLMLSAATYGQEPAMNTPQRPADAGPLREGLRLWLDASGEKTCAADASGVVLRWADKSGEGRDAAAGTLKGRPLRVGGAMNGRAVVRFSGAECFKVQGIRGERGPVQVFVVSQRLAAQAGEEKWQRLMSWWDGASKADNQPPCFALVGDEMGRGAAYGPILSEGLFLDVAPGVLTIGCNAARPMQFFKGDIAEVLVYDRPFATAWGAPPWGGAPKGPLEVPVAERLPAGSTEAADAVREYLVRKWGAARNPLDKGWTRFGPLGPQPPRVNEEYPLSDQANQGAWVRYEPMWDEFNGPELDARKWWPKNPVWRGRPPVFFHPKNVAVRDGKLLLTANKKETGEGLKELPQGYTQTSGYVKSKAPLLYGCVEMRAKVLNASMTSGFWLYDNTPEAWTEIDIVEMAAGLPDRDRKDTMNVHVFRVPGFKGAIEHHWVSGGTWTAPFRFADDYHVYGLEWDRERIAWYADGVMVRRIKNTHWHYPLNLNINIESQQTFLDNPMEERYPATYDVDYVRAWSVHP